MKVPCAEAVNARLYPQRTALSWNGRSMAWDALNNYVHSTSRYLKEIAVNPDDRVILTKAPSSPSFTIVLLALWRIGAVPCPVDPSVTGPEADALRQTLLPAWAISPRQARKTWTHNAKLLKWADIELVVAYGYNDSFLGSAEALDPQVEKEHAAMIRFDHAIEPVKCTELTHEGLMNDPGDFLPLLTSLKTAEQLDLNTFYRS